MKKANFQDQKLWINRANASNIIYSNIYHMDHFDLEELQKLNRIVCSNNRRAIILF